MELKVDNRHQQFIIDTALSIEQEHMNSDMNKFQVKEVFKTLESIMKTEENSVPLALQLSDEFMKKFLHLIYGRRELHWALKKAYARLLPQRELEIKSKLNHATFVKHINEMLSSGYILRVYLNKYSRNYLILNKIKILTDTVLKEGVIPDELYENNVFIVEFMERVQKDTVYMKKICPICDKEVVPDIGLSFTLKTTATDYKITWKCNRHFNYSIIEDTTGLVGTSTVNRLLFYYK